MLFAMSVAATAAALSTPERTLPKRLLGYATDRSLREDKVVAACRQGVNVVIWSFAHLEIDGDTPRVRPTFDVDAVRATQRRLEAENLSIRHLVAFGGWNGPHPDEKLDGRAWFEVWRAWNEDHGLAFDGCDWDLEGNDDATQNLSPAMVSLVADFCRAAKRHGYLIALAPAESYFDAGSAEVDLRLDHQPRAAWKPGENNFPATFPYAGRNAYAEILAQAGVDSVDAVSVQLYEGYSSACYALTRGGVSLSDYADEVAAGLSTRGVVVGDKIVTVPRDKLLLGFANGWADNEKFIRVEPAHAAHAVKAAGLRGAMFWVIDEEGAPYDFAARYTGALAAAVVPRRSCGNNLFVIYFGDPTRCTDL